MPPKEAIEHNSWLLIGERYFTGSGNCMCTSAAGRQSGGPWQRPAAREHQKLSTLFSQHRLGENESVPKIALCAWSRCLRVLILVLPFPIYSSPPVKEQELESAALAVAPLFVDQTLLTFLSLVAWCLC